MEFETWQIHEVINFIQNGVTSRGVCGRIAGGRYRLRRGVRLYMTIGIVMWSLVAAVIFLAIKAVV